MGIGAGLFFLFDPSKQKAQTLFPCAMSDWANGVRKVDLLVVAELFERGADQRRLSAGPLMAESALGTAQSG